MTLCEMAKSWISASNRPMSKHAVRRNEIRKEMADKGLKAALQQTSRAELEQAFLYLLLWKRDVATRTIEGQARERSALWDFAGLTKDPAKAEQFIREFTGNAL